jgi:hypothetical protein
MGALQEFFTKGLKVIHEKQMVPLKGRYCLQLVMNPLEQ